MTTLTVPDQEKPIRLDLFLIQQFGKTRAYWKDEIFKRIKVNGAHPKKGMILQGGEKLEVELEENSPDVYAADPDVSFNVILEDPDFVVVEKNSGINMHPFKTHEKGTLYQGVISKYPEIANIGNSPREGGLLHRLDQETSGLVLLARTQKAFQFLKDEFKKRRVEKEYTALVEGNISASQQKHKIEIQIAHHPKTAKKMLVLSSPSLARKLGLEGREALTVYWVIKNYPQVSLLQVHIPTGVRHQIRVHLAEVGHPILGDKLYGGGKNHLPEIPRLFLHASRLVFRHPQSLERVEVRSPLPADLSKLLQTLSARSFY